MQVKYLSPDKIKPELHSISAVMLSLEIVIFALETVGALSHKCFTIYNENNIIKHFCHSNTTIEYRNHTY